MTEEKPKSDFKKSLKKGKSIPKKKIYSDNLEKLLNKDNLLNKEEQVFIKIKENLIDKITKFAALAAVLLAFFTVVFDCSQSIKQDETFASFQQKLETTFNTQLDNSKKQHEKTIETLVTQQELMKRQNDSTIQLLRIQADRLKIQNGIWKINQKNQILSERAQILTTIDYCKLKNDSLHFRIHYINKGKRTAEKFYSKVAVLIVQNNVIKTLMEDTLTLSNEKMTQGSLKSFEYIGRFVGLIGKENFHVISSIRFTDEMFVKPSVITDFYEILKWGNETKSTECNNNQKDQIEKHSKFRNINCEDFTIRGVRQNSGLIEKRLYFCKSTKNTNKYNL